MGNTIPSSMKLDKLCEKLDKVDMSPLPIPTKELCDRYEKLYTGAINDVLREFTLMDQALPRNILPVTLDMFGCGVAFTVRSNPDPTVLGEMDVRAKMLDDMPEDCCVVWDAGEEEEAAHWGEVMTASAITRGARLAVINGGLRDTRQVLAQHFPVFCRYRSSNGSLGRAKITGYNIPVRIGKVFIKPGDIIFGDVDGVVVVPRAIAYDVLVRAEQIKGNEHEMRGWVKPGFSAVEMIDKGGYF